MAARAIEHRRAAAHEKNRTPTHGNAHARHAPIRPARRPIPSGACETVTPINSDVLHDLVQACPSPPAAIPQPGDPEDRKTAMGPLARTDLRDDLVKQIDGSVKRLTLPPGRELEYDA